MISAPFGNDSILTLDGARARGARWISFGTFSNSSVSRSSIDPCGSVTAIVVGGTDFLKDILAPHTCAGAGGGEVGGEG